MKWVTWLCIETGKSQNIRKRLKAANNTNKSSMLILKVQGFILVMTPSVWRCSQHNLSSVLFHVAFSPLKIKKKICFIQCKNCAPVAAPSYKQFPMEEFFFFLPVIRTSQKVTVDTLTHQMFLLKLNAHCFSPVKICSTHILLSSDE